MSNVVRYGTQVALIDFDSSLFFENDGNLKAQSEAMGGSSHKYCSGIMPPELIAKIDLLENRDLLRNYEEYWKHVLDDVVDMKPLFANSRKITSAVKALIAQSETANPMENILTTLRKTMKDQLSDIHDPRKNWKKVISQSLIGLSFEELPDSLTYCKTIQEFAEVWTRLKASTQFWEKIHPRISSDGRYAYMVKSYDNSYDSSIREVTDFSNSLGLLPYNLVQASTKYDIWTFGVMLFYVCSGVSPLHLTYNGHLCNFSAYEELHNWNSEVAARKISSFVGKSVLYHTFLTRVQLTKLTIFTYQLLDDPLAQNLLMKLLGREEKRLSNMELILQHPFFKPIIGEDICQVLEEYDRKLGVEETHLTADRVKYDSVSCVKQLCMEKYCKEVFNIQGDICVPTCFMILPYKLHWGSSGHFEAPQNISSLAIGEKVGKYLLEMNAVTAKLSFWVKMKVLTSEKNGTKNRARLKTWLKRARTETSNDIAREIIGCIGCDEDYEAICVEMLDEEMHISNAREFIKDPWKAASTLYNKSKRALLQYYLQSRTRAFYLIDERHATVALSEASPDDMDNVYPILMEPSEAFENIFLPLINMTVMTVTAKHGMKGLAMLLGLPSSYGIPDTWRNLNVGLVHTHDALYYSSISEFARFQQTLSRNKAVSEKEKVIKGLEAFYQQYDPQKSFCGLNRLSDRDGCNVVWTRNETRRVQKPSGRAQLDPKLQNNIVNKSAMESQAALFHSRSNRPMSQDLLPRKTNKSQGASNIIRSTTKSRILNKQPANSLVRKIPSPLSVFTPTTKQTHESTHGSMSTRTYHSTTVRDELIPTVTKIQTNEYLCSSMVATATSENYHLVAPDTTTPTFYNHSAVISTGVRQTSMLPPEDGEYSGRQGNHHSMLSSVTLKKNLPAPSDISSMVSNSTLERHQGVSYYNRHAAVKEPGSPQKTGPH